MFLSNFTTVLLFLGICSLCESNAVFRILPSDIEAKSGDTVVLRCAVSISRSCRVLWYRPNIQTYISDGTSTTPYVQEHKPGKYAVVGNNTIGEYFLQVNNVTVEDAGKYECSCGLAKKRMEFKVVQPPMEGYPKCNIEGESTTLFAGDRISLSCISRGGVPPATITWFHDGVPSENMPHLGPNFVKVRYVTYAMPSHDGSVFVCTAESPAFAEKKNCSIGPMTILSPLAMVSSLEKDDLLTEDYAIMDADVGDERGVTFSCGLKPNFTTDALINTTWFVDGVAVHSSTDDFEIIDDGNTLLFKDHMMKRTEIEVSCQVHVDGRSLGNITRLVEIGRDISYDTKGLPDNPIIYKTDTETTNIIDIRPLIILNACVIIIMVLLILLAVYSPKICNCHSPIYQEPKTCKQSKRRHADSRITELHFVQSEQCGSGVARCEGSHFYETPNGGTSNQSSASQNNITAPPLPPSHLHSSQEMQATFHVVVHSRNGGGVSQTVHKVTNGTTTTTPIPHAATVTPVNSSNNNSGSVCCVYAPVRKKSKGNLYSEDMINFQPQAHYQRVVGPPRVAEHLLCHPEPDEGLHERLLSDTLGEDKNSGITSPCSTLPSNSKLTPSQIPLSYSRTLPLTPLERKDEVEASISCGDFSDDDLDSIYANIASLEDVQKQTTL